MTLYVVGKDFHIKRGNVLSFPHYRSDECRIVRHVDKNVGESREYLNSVSETGKVIHNVTFAV